MTKPSSIDVNAVISTFYEAALDPQRWQDGLELFTKMMGAQGAILMLANPDHIAAEIAFNVGNSPEVVQDYNDYYNTIDPLVPVVPHSPVGKWVMDHPGAHWESPTAREYHHDCLLKHDISAVLATLIMREHNLAATVSVQRFGKQKLFSKKDEIAADLALPHLQRAARLHYRMQQLGVRADIGNAALDQITTPILIVDASGTVLLVNRAGEQLFQHHSMVSVRHGRFSTTQQSLAIRQAIANAARTPGARSSGLRMRGKTEADDLNVLIMPLPMQSVLAGPWQRPLALVVLHRCSITPPSVDQLLHDLYGLTPMEARVARLLADGASPAETAESLLIAVSTIRSHLKAIFSKTGLRRQADLTRLVTTLANIGSEAR